MDIADRTPAPADAAEVEALARAAAAADRVAALGEDTLLKLRRGEGLHLLARDAGGVLTGYAFADPAGDPPGGELVVHPEHRRRGTGRALAEAVLERHPDARLWAHGDLPPARGLAGAAGLTAVRTLLKMGRKLSGELAGPEFPDGVSLRAFRPGADEDEWLAVNARAFAHHPEQGRMTRADLDAREREAWFEAAGFLIAERDGRIVGFHWTKFEDGEGEVYVVGVDPDAQAGGLGSALTLAGLQHLRDRGATHVTLYVEGDNEPALKVYGRLGFDRISADVMYARA